VRVRSDARVVSTAMRAVSFRRMLGGGGLVVVLVVFLGEWEGMVCVVSMVRVDGVPIGMDVDVRMDAVFFLGLFGLFLDGGLLLL